MTREPTVQQYWEWPPSPTLMQPCTIPVSQSVGRSVRTRSLTCESSFPFFVRMGSALHFQSRLLSYIASVTAVLGCTWYKIPDGVLSPVPHTGSPYLAPSPIFSCLKGPVIGSTDAMQHVAVCSPSVYCTYVLRMSMGVASRHLLHQREPSVASAPDQQVNPHTGVSLRWPLVLVPQAN